MIGTVEIERGRQAHRDYSTEAPFITGGLVGLG